MGTGEEYGQDNLFQADNSVDTFSRLDLADWPDHATHPVNRRHAQVRELVWSDLTESDDPLLVTGYASIDQLVRLIADWSTSERGTLRVLLGTEPFSAANASYRSHGHSFTREVRDYWRKERGISILLSAKLIVALEAISAGRVCVRFVRGSRLLHAKIYVGTGAATTGSSNFTKNGLGDQIEANVRFEKDGEPGRYADLVRVAENLWDVGSDWTAEFTSIVEGLLKVVGWREALARACADVLEGDWAAEQLDHIRAEDSNLWPSQLVGIAQAMWIVENVGGVLVADATGSGKTRMGAHLVRAVRDNLGRTGRAGRGLTILVSPPGVQATWEREAAASGLNLKTISHGQLTTRDTSAAAEARGSVQRAQLLAVDEAHNFLSATSQRARILRTNLADHVVLFTATPISRGAADLLDIIALLGPDNFDDRTHEILRRLGRVSGGALTLAAEDEDAIRKEIQRFTLRRTKTDLNSMIDRDPEAYRHPTTARVCRYPEHRASAYDTEESANDERCAEEIRLLTKRLRGLATLPREIVVPPSLRAHMSDEQWLRFRERSAAGLARHNVMSALRSSRAALHEHLVGSASAVGKFGLPTSFKTSGTGNTIGKVQRELHSPPTVKLSCHVPDWLTDPDAWTQARDEEIDAYQSILAAMSRMSADREKGKANLLLKLSRDHDRVIAFDRHLITLEALLVELDGKVDVMVATSKAGAKQKLQKRFAPEAEVERPVVALCSDAMNEGLNLQGASAMVHLDLPTTLRVAEQRVGRVDRMDSRHDHIEALWPRDGPAFATRANERLVRRVEESASLIGSNLEVPRLDHDDDDEIVAVEEVWSEVDDQHPSDRLVDALEPVRALVSGPTSLLSIRECEEFRSTTSQVVARISPLSASTDWAFFSVRAAVHRSPRWMFVDGASSTAVCTTDLVEVTQLVRSRLEGDPEDHPMDASATTVLERLLEAGAHAERRLLPRRIQRCVEQLTTVARAWTDRSGRAGDAEDNERWRSILNLVQTDSAGEAADLFEVGESWFELIAARLEEHRRTQRGRRYVLINDLTSSLIKDPPPLGEIERHMEAVRMVPPFGDRVTACILGVGTDRSVGIAGLPVTPPPPSLSAINWSSRWRAD